MIAVLRREPVSFGAALLVTADGAAVLWHTSVETQGILHGIAVLWVAWAVRCLSTPTVTVAAKESAARDGALADVASLQPAPKPSPRKRAKP
jgi:hypothetical protein